ncbi:MAG: hypothetical protein ABIJ65_02040 [Chloroflexota bacterium]
MVKSVQLMVEDMQIRSRVEIWHAVTALPEKDLSLASVDKPITSKATPRSEQVCTQPDHGKSFHIPRKTQLHRLVQKILA